MWWRSKTAAFQSDVTSEGGVQFASHDDHSFFTVFSSPCSLLSEYSILHLLLVMLAVAPMCFQVTAQFGFMRITNMKKNCTNKCLIATKSMTIYFPFFTSHPVLELFRKSRSCSWTIQSPQERWHILVTQRLPVVKALSYYATWTFSLSLTLTWPQRCSLQHTVEGYLLISIVSNITAGFVVTKMTTYTECL